jgi:voltage-gated potassium channel Kch
MKWRYARLCGLLTLTILLEMPLRAAGYGTLLFGLLLVAVVYAAASAASSARLIQRTYLGLVTPIILIDLKMITTGASDALALAGAAFHVGLLSFAGIAILLHVAREERVSLDTILGGVCVYLLIGETFTFLYSTVELLRPGAFLDGGKLLATPPHVNHLLGRRPELTYFSFITLTTLGYGDILPATPFARVLAVAEALCGQIFLTTFLAFLVGNYLAQRQDDRQRATEL